MICQFDEFDDRSFVIRLYLQLFAQINDRSNLVLAFYFCILFAAYNISIVFIQLNYILFNMQMHGKRIE